ncbi:MAG: hypothetical protein NT062_04240, partial [Proteobacteria bacterium]|nr:hypothetical protein [Pseudomonadota bacterium]
MARRAGVRVVELGRQETKATVSPIGAPPWGDPVGLEVGDDGTVLDLEPEHAWWLVGGKVVLERPVDVRIAATRHGEVERYATRRDAAPEHAVGLFGRAGELARWQLPDPLRVWVGAQDQLVVETMFSADEPSHLDRTLPEGALAPIVRFTSDGDVRDLDPQGDVAIGAGGQIFLVRVADGVRPAF